MGGLRDVLIFNAYKENYLKMIIQTSLKREIAFKKPKAINSCIVKIIYTQKDYEIYKQIKALKSQIIIKEQIFIKENESFTYPSSLLDSKGYYYLKLPLDENPNLYL